MSQRIRGVLLLIVVLGVGAFLGSALGQWMSRPSQEDRGPDFSALGRVRVQVLNGGGVPGLAREAVDELREIGFDVVEYGNRMPFSGDSSVVLDRVGRPDRARAVADALGIRELHSQPDSNLYVDVSVVLGVEWRPVEAGARGSTSPWWDLRRFFKDVTDSRPDSGGVDRWADPGDGGR